MKRSPTRIWIARCPRQTHVWCVSAETRIDCSCGRVCTFNIHAEFRTLWRARLKAWYFARINPNAYVMPNHDDGACKRGDFDA